MKKIRKTASKKVKTPRIEAGPDVLQIGGGPRRVSNKKLAEAHAKGIPLMPDGAIVCG